LSSRVARGTAFYAALGNLPASLIVCAFNACPDLDPQSNYSQFLKHFRKKMNCGSETERVEVEWRLTAPALFMRDLRQRNSSLEYRVDLLAICAMSPGRTLTG